MFAIYYFDLCSSLYFCHQCSIYACCYLNSILHYLKMYSDYLVIYLSSIILATNVRSCFCRDFRFHRSFLVSCYFPNLYCVLCHLVYQWLMTCFCKHFSGWLCLHSCKLADTDPIDYADSISRRMPGCQYFVRHTFDCRRINQSFFRIWSGSGCLDRLWLIYVLI